MSVASLYAVPTTSGLRWKWVYAASDAAETDAITTVSGNVLANDLGTSVSQVAGSAGNVGVAVAGSNGGLFTIASDGAWTFDPDGDFSLLTGSETADTSVTYYASDGAAEASATLTVTVSAVASTAWTPAEITTAQWLDFADDTTITLDGSVITQISDKSGNSRHATASGTARPVYSNSLAVFDGVDDRMTISVPQAKPSHIFAVINTTALQTGYRSFLGRDISSNTNSPALYLGAASYDYKPTIYWEPTLKVITDVTSRRALRVQEYRFGVSDVGLRSNDGAEQVSSTALTTMSSWVDIGHIALYPSQAPAMSVGEIIIVNAVLSIEDRQRIAGYLAHKWDALLGVTTLVSALPADHPYKSAPPTI